ncbi:uncharacterized protein BDW47DRAFT_99117 [Aspergillus candidus]|uniref:Uncharacterized protein n=1 Tax=Aspergillus candidus TaxID=41067 RepID=A0A2I2FLE8_ASPCN|nr:hypothetical protein BDW47DRAFT_99117 [Aspergillus candidus]PLB41467.1 hypothetical protein BDW47DRAFT_99117 [Aspergillus candidus]
MLRKAFEKEKVPEDLLEQAGELTQLPRKDLKKVIRSLLRSDLAEHEDMYMIFLKTKAEGMYHGRDRQWECLARLQCLVNIDRETAQQTLANLKKPGNILQALESLMQKSKITEQDGKRAILQFVLNCSQARAARCFQSSLSITDMIHGAHETREVSEQASLVAQQAYLLLLEPENVEHICAQEIIAVSDTASLYDIVERRGITRAIVPLLREWKEIYFQEVQDIIDSGYGDSLQAAQTEYLTRLLMKEYKVDRAHAKSELEAHHGSIDEAGKACKAHAECASKRLKVDPVIPTRDTQNAPNVTPQTRVIAVLGVDEPSSASKAASPSLGDGWMVSDFYLWLHVLDGMGKDQKWITSMSPDYLLQKYGKEDKVTLEVIDDDEPEVTKPVRTKWASGFIHGDPFETRKVVLDENLLPQVLAKVTIGPKGDDLRDFFMQQLKNTMADAAEFGDDVLIMIFSHGDYDSAGGLCLGVDLLTDGDCEQKYLKPSHIASILSEFPSVRTTMFMTSCFSGHWVETTDFSGKNLTATTLAAAETEQEPFGFAWSNSQRHAGGLFSSAAISELVKEPPFLPPAPDEDTSREYRELTTALVAEMHRLCLPVNIDYGYGSSPVFSDPESQEKFWKRTGYSLHHYKENYDKLPTALASDPHPKRDRKKFEAGFIDGDDPEIVAWKERYPLVVDEDFPEATGGYGRTARGLLSPWSLKYLMRQYSSSNPGHQTIEHQVVFRTIREYYEGLLDVRGKLRLRRVLINRLQMNKRANQYAKILGLYWIPNIEDWFQAQTSRAYEYSTFQDYSRKVAQSGIFHDGKIGPYYRKPSQYLAAAMAIAAYSEDDVDAAIKRIWQARHSKQLDDPITLSLRETGRYVQSISSIKSLLQKPRDKRPALSDAEWSGLSSSAAR